MIREGAAAPDFELPGTAGGTDRRFSLDATASDGNATLLLFYPFDFSPVCRTELCALRDAKWFDLTENLNVWAVSGDSVYSHRAFADQFDLAFPLLSDSNAAVASAYDVRYDEWEGHRDVPKRAVFVVDSDRTIAYAWSTEDATEKPEFAPVKEAVDELAAIADADVSPAETDFDLTYESVD